MAGHIVVDVGSLNPEPLRSAGAVHSRTHRTRSSPPPRAGFLRERTAPAVSWSGPDALPRRQGPLRSRCTGRGAAPADLREGHPAIRGGVRGASRLPAGHGCRWSRLIASWLVVYRCRGLEQHDDANDSNPDPVQPPAGPVLVVVTSPWCSGRRENHRCCDLRRVGESLSATAPAWTSACRFLRPPRSSRAYLVRTAIGLFVPN